MSSHPDQTTTAADLGAVVEAIRARERFLVTTHENPDGDALGSLLASHLALEALGKDSVMFLAGPAPLPGEYRFLPLDGLLRELPADAAERALLAVDCANESRLGADAAVLHQAPFTVNVDHHHDNSRFGDVNLVDDAASSTGEVLRDVFRELGLELTPELAEPLYVALVTDTGRFQYANTTPKALRLAAELVEAGADVHKVFQGVYESVQFAKLKLLARALERAQVYEGGGLVVSYLLRDDFAEVGAVEPYSEGIIDFLRAVEGARHGRPDPRAAAWRQPGAADLAPRLARRARRLRDRARLRRRRAPSGRRLLERRLDRGDHRVPPPRVRRRPGCRLMPPKGLEPSGIILVDKPAGPSSFAIVARVRSRTGTKMGHAGTLDPFATGLLLLLSGRSTKLAGSFVGLDKRYLTDVDLTARTSTGDPEGEVVERLAAPDAAELERRLEPLRGEIELPIPAASAVKIGGERAYKLHRRGVEVEMPLRRSQVHALDVIAYTDGVVRLDLRVSSGTYVRAIAEALGGHCTTLRRLEVGPFSVEDADEERVIPAEEALALLP